MELTHSHGLGGTHSLGITVHHQMELTHSHGLGGTHSLGITVHHQMELTHIHGLGIIYCTTEALEIKGTSIE
jgi:hypothetical protein